MEQNKREIKFRGRALERIDEDTKKGDWVYGNLITNNGNPFIIGNIISSDCDCIELEFWIPVDPNTVGQFTGLLDKNGKEIYCSDIVKGYFDTNEVEDYIWLSLTDEEKKNGWKLFKIDMDIVEFARQQLPDELEIVGNVMENPNLLSEKEE